MPLRGKPAAGRLCSPRDVTKRATAADIAAMDMARDAVAQDKEQARWR